MNTDNDTNFTLDKEKKLRHTRLSFYRMILVGIFGTQIAIVLQLLTITKPELDIFLWACIYSAAIVIPTSIVAIVDIEVEKEIKLPDWLILALLHISQLGTFLSIFFIFFHFHRIPGLICAIISLVLVLLQFILMKEVPNNE